MGVDCSVRLLRCCFCVLAVLCSVFVAFSLCVCCVSFACVCYVVHHLALEVLHVLFGFCWRVLRSSCFVEGQQTIVFKKSGARASSD